LVIEKVFSAASAGCLNAACSDGALGYDCLYVQPKALGLLLTSISLALGQANAPQSPSTDLLNRTLTGVEYDPPLQPLPRSELDAIVPLAPGTPLTSADIRATLQALYSTGRYHDIAIDAVPEGSGVRIRILTTLNYFTSGVQVSGENEPPSASQLETAAKLPLGEPVEDTQIEAASRNIMERLRNNGLYHARIQRRVERTPTTQEASVFFEINPGPRARFDGVKLEGNYNSAEEAVIRATRWRRGILFFQLPGWREMTESRIQQGVQNVLRNFQKGNRLEARVNLTGIEYHPETNRVTPTLEIERGPVVEVRTTGAKVSPGRLRQLIPIYQERTVDRTLLQEGRRNLVEYFQAQGYFDAGADFTQSSTGGDHSFIEYNIMRGVRHKVVRVDIAGNRYFDTETLLERMNLRPAGFLVSRFGRFSQRFLDQDKNAISDLYRANGFRDVQIKSEVVDDYGGKANNIAVRIEVQEGLQWIVNSLDIDGVLDEDREYLNSIIQSSPGQPFSEANIAADRDEILTYYFNNGYPEATFDWTQSEGAPQRMDLKFVVRPGPRQFVRGVLVSGLKTTKPSLVNSRIRLEAGSPISQSRIVESQQELYNLGIFSKVQTAIQNPDSDEQDKYVLFHVDEARKYSFTMGFGAELARIGGGSSTSFDAPAGEAGFSPRGSLGISRINFLGLGHVVSLQGLASTLQQRVVLAYSVPQFTGNENLALTFGGRFDDSRDVRTFTSRRWEGSIQLAERVTRANTVQFRYVFRRVTIDQNTLKISPGLIPLYSQPVRVGLLGFSFIQDRRDDPLDSHRGIYNTLDLGFAARPFGSETDFGRLLFRNSTYHRVGRNLVLARTLQFGYQQRFGGLAQIPLAERFFSGGSSTLRAFPDNQAGPRDLETGFPLGGNALLMHSTELRFPLIGDNIGGVLFHDMGNVYSDVRNISFRFRQKNLQDFDYMVHSVGFGIRYRTPLGPIRADFSLSPNPPRFFGFAGTRDQLLAGQGTQTNQRINVFQFHFSLGQTF
jgi:outer membrane protein insertion porin family